MHFMWTYIYGKYPALLSVLFEQGGFIDCSVTGSQHILSTVSTKGTLAVNMAAGVSGVSNKRLLPSYGNIKDFLLLFFDGAD